MNRFLIVYATREGQTEKIAGHIALQLRAAGADVTVHDARETLPEGAFDVVVYGGSMHAGAIESELVDFMRTRHRAISPARTHFFLVLLSAANRDPVERTRSLEDALQKTRRALPIDVDDIEMIAGALMYSKYRWPVKWIMKRFAAKAGGDTDTRHDYEYTDWDQVDAYARRLLQG